MLAQEEVDLETYDQDGFEEEEDAQEIKNSSQVNKEPQQLLAVSAPDLNTDGDAEPGRGKEEGDALDLGEDYEDEDEDGDGEVNSEEQVQVESEETAAALRPQAAPGRESNPYNSAGPQASNNTGKKQKPYRLNSQQNKRSEARQNQMAAAHVEGQGGRPLTKHQQRSRISNSQGGIRQKQRPAKQPFSAQANSGFQNTGPVAPGSFSQNQFPVGQEYHNRNQKLLSSGPRHTSSGYPQSSYGQLFDSGNSPQNVLSAQHQIGSPFYQMPVKPMYQSMQSGARIGSNSSAQKGNRVYQQIIHNNGSGNILFSSTNMPLSQPMQGARRRVDYASMNNQNFKAYQTPIFRQIEKEEVRNMYRNLKIQYNITRDENTRLRTQAKQMDVDLQKKEKDIENLTRSLQQQANYMHSGGHAPVSQKTNYLESFLVQQLKRQNRELKLESQTKDRQIEELKKNVKLSKHRENDNEVQAFADECMRLRSLLEQTLIQNDALAQHQAQQSQQQAETNENLGLQEDQARLQEALYEQENILNQEREEKNNLHVSLMGSKEEKNRLLEKLKVAENKAKKYTESMNDAKRKQKMIQEKNRQIEMLQAQLEQNKQKALKVDKIASQNADLVTRKCALETSVQSKDKKIQDLESKNRHLESVVRELEQQQVAPQPAGSSHQQRNDSNMSRLSRSNTTGNRKLNTSGNLGGGRSNTSADQNKASMTSKVASSVGNKAPKQGTTTVIDSREEQSKSKSNTQTQGMNNNNSTVNQTQEVNNESERIVKEDELEASHKSNPAQVTTGQRPRSRPSDKQPVKRGNSSSSQTKPSQLEQTQVAKVGQNLLDESDEDGEEEYEPQFDEDEDEENDAPVNQMLNKSKPSMQLGPVNEEVKEMKSVEEEDSEDEEKIGALNLQDINDIATPKEPEQNQQSFRLEEDGQGEQPETEKPETAAVEAKAEQKEEEKKDGEDEEDEDYSQDQEQLESLEQKDQAQPAEEQQKEQKEAQEDEEEEQYEEDYEQEADQNQEQEAAQIEIGEEQMLDIAEAIFNMIAQCLMMHNLTVRQTFGGEDIIYNLPEFDGEKNVEVMTADDFITRCYEIGVQQLDRIQVDCLMRVLGKPELSNAIKLVDLETLMSNFGPPSPREVPQQPAPAGNKQFEEDNKNEEDAQPAQEGSKPAPKPNKRKMQISQLIDGHPQLSAEFLEIIDAVGLDGLKAKIGEKVYKMLAKLKKNNKQINESVVNRDDFLEVLRQINDKGISEEVQALMQPLVQVNPNHGHIYQAKIVNFLLDEVVARREVSKIANIESTQNGGQVLSFKQLESDDEK